jgi:serine/threonine protein kinase
MKSGIQRLLAAIEHLHLLGLTRNDINPANFFPREESTLILIDFDSCRYIEKFLRGTETKRIRHWHDASVDVSTEKNDTDTFYKLAD